MTAPSDPDRVVADEAGSAESVEIRREAATMALYLAIVLLAESIPLQAYDLASAEVVGTYWGTAIGLAIAHVFAFTLSARLVTHARLDPTTRRSAAAQIGGAGLVAALATVPFWILSGLAAAFTVSGALLAVLIGATGFEASRGAGGSVRRSLIVAAITLATAALVVALKATLAH